MVALRDSMSRKIHSSSSPWTSSRSRGRLGEERPSVFVGSPGKKEEGGEETAGMEEEKRRKTGEAKMGRDKEERGGRKNGEKGV